MMNMHDKNSFPPPFIYRLVIFIFDNILDKIGFFLFPFKFLTLLATWLSRFVWLLSNEYSKRSFGSCGRGVRIYDSFYLSAPSNFKVGDNVHIGSNAFLRAEGGIVIGDNTHISRNLTIYSMNHNYQGELLPYDSARILKPVKIGRNVWIGMNVTIVPGVEIGDGAIIGMGAIVAKSVPPLAVVGSASQRILKERDAEHYRKLDEANRYAGMSGYTRKDKNTK